jgi:collagenase-like PrtC family protease
VPTMTLTLGPLLFNWPAGDWLAFYRRIAEEAPVDRVCLGDIVCSKRWPFITSHSPAAIEMLLRAGKSVVLSLPILPTLERERRLVEELMAIPDVQIEANDVSALTRLGGRSHAIGPFVNVYNEGTLRYLAASGATQVCLPPELPMASIRALAEAVDISLEVWAFGRVPLAISARCYHARLHGRSKDSCHFVCGDDPDGRTVEDLDGRPFLAINGVQTLSDSYCSLLGEIDELARVGVRSLRLSPHSTDMAAVARLFRDTIDRRMSAREARRRLAELMPSATFSNGFLHGQPGWQCVPPRAKARSVQAVPAAR